MRLLMNMLIYLCWGS